MPVLGAIHRIASSHLLETPGIDLRRHLYALLMPTYGPQANLAECVANYRVQSFYNFVADALATKDVPFISGR